MANQVIHSLISSLNSKIENLTPTQWVIHDNNYRCRIRKNTLAAEILFYEITDSTSFAALPAAYRPPREITVPLTSNESGTIYTGFATIGTDGTITINVSELPSSAYLYGFVHYFL